MHWLVEHGPGKGDVMLATIVANEEAFAVRLVPKNDSRELRIGVAPRRRCRPPTDTMVDGANHSLECH